MIKFWEILMAPGRVMHQRAERMNAQRIQFEEAMKQLDLDRIVQGYKPKLAQRALDAVDWKTPWPSADLIEQERSLIARYLEAHWDRAKFPERPGFIVRAGMEKVWAKLQGRIHQHVFGQLDLPLFFDLTRDPAGLVMFEMTYRDTDRHGREQWIGRQSKWIYGRTPPAFANPLSGGAK
ncbi:hypothetical protein [Ruegeria sp.]|uniref:hypothetical protein n=1 Tax=Ruegeria sp. TaxID=1879320 RepID=UPI00231C9898|nr:hypothetical protein [Ruegeria sp.]MDA7966218.1 hypothetical protein [Ruegeria sp.]